MNFWRSSNKPFIGQAPMDGISDAAFRYITDKFGRPSVLITEFVSVEGLINGAAAQLSALMRHKTKTPTVAQLYGVTPRFFRDIAVVVAELGFDGIDINMGCPEKGIVRRGAGCGLIRNPKLAQDIIRAVKAGVYDWYNGKSLSDLHLPGKILNFVNQLKSRVMKRRLLPVSVKTRIGYDKPDIKNWITALLESQPEAIILHGRTLQQLYQGKANWEIIGIAASLAKNTDTTLIGNGDIKSIREAINKIRQYNLGGVLIGRALCGNPWLLQDKIPSLEERLMVTLEHCQTFIRITPHLHFLSLRKHLNWYMKVFPHASRYRELLMKIKTLEDVEAILNEISNKFSQNLFFTS